VEVNDNWLFISWCIYEIIIFIRFATIEAIEVYCLYEFISLVNVILRERNKKVEELYYVFNNRFSDNEKYRKYKKVE